MPSGLLDRLKRILPLADKVADEVVYEETEVLEGVIPRMFEVMHRVAKFSCDYVKRGGVSSNGLNLETTDDCSENGSTPSLSGENRRNGERVDGGHRRLRPCSECRGSLPIQEDW